MLLPKRVIVFPWIYPGLTRFLPGFYPAIFVRMYQAGAPRVQSYPAFTRYLPGFYPASSRLSDGRCLLESTRTQPLSLLDLPIGDLFWPDTREHLAVLSRFLCADALLDGLSSDSSRSESRARWPRRSKSGAGTLDNIK